MEREMMIRNGHKPSTLGSLPTNLQWRCEKCFALEKTPVAHQICPKAEMVHISVLRSEVEAIGRQFGGSTSTKKIAKKVKQVYGRNIRLMAKEKVDGTFKDFEEHIRPKPRYIPEKIWKVIQNIVLKDYN